MEPKTQIKSHNVISVKIDPSILNDFLDINLSKETKNIIIDQAYIQTKNQFSIIRKNKLEQDLAKTITFVKTNIKLKTRSYSF